MSNRNEQDQSESRRRDFVVVSFVGPIKTIEALLKAIWWLSPRRTDFNR